jgi:hypothetical protein
LKLAKQILDFYINSSLHVAFAIASLVGVTAYSLHIEQFKNTFLLVFFGTLFGYNTLKYLEPIFKGTFKINKHKTMIFITIFSIFSTVFLFFQLLYSAQLLLVMLFVLVCVYPFVRKLGWLKIFWVAFCVAEITVHLPLMNYQAGFPHFLLLLIQRFVIVIALLIPFEIYDSTIDDVTLKTLPQRFGITKTKIFGYCLLILFLGLNFFNASLSIVSVFISFVSFLSIYFSSKNQSSYFTSFWVESIPILWFILCIIHSNTVFY